MPLPHLIQVGPRLIRVLREDPKGSGKGTADLGEFTSEASGYVIRVAPGLSDSEAQLVFLHELLHAVSDLGGAALTERQVLCLEQGLGAFARHHPEAWQSISDVQDNNQG